MADDSDSMYEFGFEKPQRAGSDVSEMFKLDDDDEVVKLPQSPEAFKEESK